MQTIDSPILPILGIPVMALTCWALSRWLPLLATESRTHAASLPLDGLRGVLASSVFFHHSYVTWVFMHTGEWVDPASKFYAQLGPSAVMMFFFISSYLFWGKMLKDPRSLRPARLWPNRLRRIMPAYWTCVALSLIVIAIATSFELREPMYGLISGAAQWIFVGFPSLPDLNGVAQQRATGGVFWTLRSELLFYLLLPALAWFRKGWRLIVFVALAIAANRILHYSQPAGGIAASIVDDLRRFTNSLATGFSVGMLAAYGATSSAPWNKRLQEWLNTRWAAAMGLALLCVQLFLIPANYSWYEPVLLTPAFFMIAAGNSFFGILSSTPMRCLGQTSYSVYIFHGLLLFTLTSLWNRLQPIHNMTVPAYWSLILAIGIVVAAVSTLTYWYIERPFMRSHRLPATPMNVPRAA
jgi:peptidoglycan/LPS O-acetylase OafA/YrhL